MLPDFKKIIEVFECMNLDNNAFFTFQNQDNLKVCVQYEKKWLKKEWAFWYSDHEANSKQHVSAQHLPSTLSAFKIGEKNFLTEVSNILLVQAAFADEFIRQMKDLFGVEVVQKTILDTQNFMDALKESVDSILKTNDNDSESNTPSISKKEQGERIGLRVVK